MRLKLLVAVLAALAWVVLLAASALAQGGELVAAEYGVPGRRVDVAQQVRSLVRGGKLHFEVTNANLGGDPAPEQPKDLVIRLRHWGGDTQEYAFPEKSVVDLNLDPDSGYERGQGRGLHILRAFYGAQGQFMDVTELLRRKVDGNRLHMHINNDTMGGDPGPKVHKHLRVLYVYNGEQRNATVPESSDLRIP